MRAALLEARRRTRRLAARDRPGPRGRSRRPAAAELVAVRPAAVPRVVRFLAISHRLRAIEPRLLALVQLLSLYCRRQVGPRSAARKGGCRNRPERGTLRLSIVQ